MSAMDGAAFHVASLDLWAQSASISEACGKVDFRSWVAYLANECQLIAVSAASSAVVAGFLIVAHLSLIMLRAS